MTISRCIADAVKRLVISHSFRSQALISCILILTGSRGVAGGPILTTLHNFVGGADGAYPDGNIVVDPASGILYGTTLLGGSFNSGTIYKLEPPSGESEDWVEIVLYTFTGGSDGAQPGAGLIFGKNGALYGTAAKSNGAWAGSVFELTPHRNGSWTYKTIYQFSGGLDGGAPNCNLLFDKNGNLFGTTSLGGTYQNGTVFELTLSEGRSAWTESVLYSLDGTNDGSRPMAGLIQDSEGVLYGTAALGGAQDFGTVFRLSPPAGESSAWTFEVLHTFIGGTDGRIPIGGLLLGSKGVLYGTTWLGGHLYGTVFELTPPTDELPTWTEKLVYEFSGFDGANPSAPLMYDPKSNCFFGTTMGFLVGYGNVFKLTPRVGNLAWTEEVLCTFVSGPDDGQNPISSVISYRGALYSISYYGGTTNQGTLFQVEQKQGCQGAGSVTRNLFTKARQKGC